MSEAGRAQDRAERPRDPEEPAIVAPVSTPGAGRGLLDDADGLLDEIDAVLETNAEEFIRGYVQKGGQ